MARVGWFCSNGASAQSSTVSLTSVGPGHSAEPFSVHRRSVSPVELCPGSPRGCCPLLPKARCMGLTKRQCQLSGALLGKTLPTHPAVDRALPRLGGDRGDLASAEVKAGAGTNLMPRRNLYLWPYPPELGDLQPPLQEQGCSQS